MTTTTPPLDDRPPTARPTLAQLVAESRRPKKPKTSQLDAHRAELLKVRREGAALRAIREGLAKMDVIVSEEALRLWFKAHTRRSPKTEARRQAATAAAVAAIHAEAVATALPPLKTDPKSEAPPTTVPVVPVAISPLAPLSGAPPSSPSSVNPPTSPLLHAPLHPWPNVSRRPRIARDDF
ncbi:MAG: hypothetical protein ABIQ12_16025 [Opitutaceae bacterium]